MKDLFKEINPKPENLDHNIMSEIYRAVENKKKAQIAEKRLWSSTWFLIGLLALAGVGFFVLKTYKPGSHQIWVMGLAFLIPVLLDKLWEQKFHKHG